MRMNYDPLRCTFSKWKLTRNLTMRWVPLALFCTVCSRWQSGGALRLGNESRVDKYRADSEEDRRTGDNGFVNIMLH